MRTKNVSPSDPTLNEAIERAAFHKLSSSTSSKGATPKTKASSGLSALLEQFDQPVAADPTLVAVARKYQAQVDALAKTIQRNFAGIIAIKKTADESVAKYTTLIKELDAHVREEQRAPTVAEIRARAFLCSERERIAAEFQQRTGQERDFFYAVHREVLKAFGQQLQTGRIAEVPYVTSQLDKITALLERGETVFLHGDTGAGKTEVAKIAARVFSGKEPLVVRGYPGMAQEEIFGHLTLSAKGLERAAEVVGQIEREIAHWEKENKGASKKKRTEACELITKKLLQESRVTVVDYVLGAQYRAMKEGRVIIFDEANAIPAALRRKLNDLKTKKVGELVTVQEDSGMQFVVAKGYGEIETANLGVRYGERKDGGRFSYTPDELDRRQGYIEYDYLPQAVKGGFREVASAKDKQVFMIAVAALLDHQGNIVAPKGVLEKLWTLSQYAALTQQAFAGTIGAEHEFVQGGTKVRVATDTLISPRGLQSILNAWRAEGYQYELDFYIASNLLPRTTDSTKRAYLYQLGQSCGLFANAAGWPTLNTGVSGGKVPQFKIDPPKNSSADITMTPMPEVVEAIWGAAPARSDWSAVRKAEVDQVREEERLARMRALDQLLANIGELEKRLAEEDAPSGASSRT